MTHKAGAEPPDHRTRSAGLETGEETFVFSNDSHLGLGGGGAGNTIAKQNIPIQVCPSADPNCL